MHDRTVLLRELWPAHHKGHFLHLLTALFFYYHFFLTGKKCHHMKCKYNRLKAQSEMKQSTAHNMPLNSPFNLNANHTHQLEASEKRVGSVCPLKQTQSSRLLIKWPANPLSSEQRDKKKSPNVQPELGKLSCQFLFPLFLSLSFITRSSFIAALISALVLPGILNYNYRLAFLLTSETEIMGLW